ncbi:unnamed protein product [Didymodactylos carnosus]|uniref:Uncharacterized protein n=1 Tax=Didymodactylos carnosus TaxID=1234261 RepID=A0A815W4J1_9BILA|nr:unnamed protein product [Didymodactylos carnosus]CAF1538835.1 unnamed protein product [Didymodactylos carnosus]CAF3692870.1 unnamed protein product [Didymodactylos carnosus]CAF4398955.1 unnamed protein product [Didymodactylos carnosus]
MQVVRAQKRFIASRGSLVSVKEKFKKQIIYRLGSTRAKLEQISFFMTAFDLLFEKLKNLVQFNLILYREQQSPSAEWLQTIPMFEKYYITTNRGRLSV